MKIGRNDNGSAKSAIIAHLSQSGPTRRAELEAVTGFGMSRVNDFLRELIADGIVVAEGPRDPGGAVWPNSPEKTFMREASKN